VDERARMICSRLEAWEKQKATGSDGYFDGIGHYMRLFEDDIAWLLERESQMMGALKMMSVMALHCCDSAIARDSLDECLRDFGFTLDEVEARDEQ
jgi:hypothetical protein